MGRIVAGRDIVEVLIRDLRVLVRAVGGLCEPNHDAEAGHEDLGRLITGLVTHLVIEDLVVRPIITHVLQREELIEQRTAETHLIVHRSVRARHAEGPGVLQSRMRHVRIDLTERAQTTEIGLLSHAYRVFDGEARRILAHRHPEARRRMFEELRRHEGATCSPPRGVDRSLITGLERIASEALELQGLVTPSAITAVPQRTSSTERGDRVGPGPAAEGATSTW